MKQRTSFLEINNRALPWQEVVAGYCLAVVFSFLFVFAQFSKTGNASDNGFDAKGDRSLISDASSNFDHHPILPPVDSEPVLPEPEGPDGGEVKDGCDDESGKLFFSFPSERTLIQICSVSRFMQLKLAIESRPQISLFILHHSWKSFLF